MHIINLSLNCKTATGDGTRIVCMNSDYVVRITAEDCGTFTESPVKKLVIRHNREYQEVDIKYVTIEDEIFLQATLPPIAYKDFVDLGVCGKTTDEPNAIPVYTSTSTRFTCEQSVLNGVVAQISAPTLMELQVNQNGTYIAGEHAADGFSKVEVNVAGSDTESRTVPLSMANGNQKIEPSSEGLSMRNVIITKPYTMRPENIVKGVDIGGVVGTYENIFEETIISEDGEYTPPAGVDGFSKVTVTVAKSSREKTMRVGHKFTYEYNARATVELSMPGVVQYADTGDCIEFTAVAIGNCSVTIKDYDSVNNLVNTVYYDVSVTKDGDLIMPIEISSASEMRQYLERDVAGGVLRYVGETTGDYKQNALYLIEEA